MLRGWTTVSDWVISDNEEIYREPMGWRRNIRPYGRCIYFHTHSEQALRTHGKQQAERHGFPCIPPSFYHMQSFQSNDLQWTHKETSVFKHTATQERERKRHRWHQLSRHDKDSRLVGRSWHTHLPEEDLNTIRRLQHYHKRSRHSHTVTLTVYVHPVKHFIALSYSQHTLLTF